jgi:serine/threonine-protein kinase HipA
MANRPPLGVWLDGVRIAELEAPRPWTLRCRYTAEALDRWPRNSPVISCSLPLQRSPLDASAFARGLLPEGQQLAAMAQLARVAANDTYSLLARFGRDVAGALVIAADEPDPRREGVVPLDDDDLAAEVANLAEQPLGLHDDSELSIAGLQDKMLLVDLGDGRFGRPVHGRPSTHILKVDDRRRPGLVRAEAECLALARAAGVTTVDAEIRTIADLDCLVVSRFDRRAVVNRVTRVHQEDACQAMGIDFERNRGRAKYEDAGGPSFAGVADLLERHAADGEHELRRLLAAATFTVAIGNADAHGKNLALVHPTPTTVELAPLYDTVPTVLWPRLRTRAAMSVNGRTEIGAITGDDLVAEAVRWHLDPRRAREVVTATIERLRQALDSAVIDPESAVARQVRGRVDALTLR